MRRSAGSQVKLAAFIKAELTDSCTEFELPKSAATTCGHAVQPPSLHANPSALYCAVRFDRLRLSAIQQCGVHCRWHAFVASAAHRSKPKPLEYLKSVLDIKQKYAYLVDHALGKNTRSVPASARQHRLAALRRARQYPSTRRSRAVRAWRRQRRSSWTSAIRFSNAVSKCLEEYINKPNNRCPPHCRASQGTARPRHCPRMRECAHHHAALGAAAHSGACAACRSSCAYSCTMS